MSAFSRSLIWKKVIETYKYYDTGFSFKFTWDSVLDRPNPIPYLNFVNEESIRSLEIYWFNQRTRNLIDCGRFPNFDFYCCPRLGLLPAERVNMSRDNVRALIIYLLNMKWETANNILNNPLLYSSKINCLRKGKHGSVIVPNCNVLIEIDVWRQGRNNIPVPPPPPIINPPSCGPRGCITPPIWSCPRPRRCAIPVRGSLVEKSADIDGRTSKYRPAPPCSPESPLGCFPTTNMRDKVNVFVRTQSCCFEQELPFFYCS
jgi:hypothetical protein